jgi:uncharacterized cupin superfamily protein
MTAPALSALIQQADLDTLPLTSSGPREGATAGTPEESALEIYSDDRVQLGVWECTPGEFPTEKKGISEHMHILAGDATLHGDDGSAVELGPGVSIVAPDGFTGRWEIRSTIRKIYTVWKTV